MEKYIIGIDPGFTGYISVLDPNGNYVSHFKTPIIVDVKQIKKRKTGKISKKTKTSLDEELIFNYVRSLKKYKNIHVFVEKQHAITGQGLASTAKTMYGFGFWCGLLRGLGIKYSVITARNWQKQILDPNIEDTKESSVKFVKETYPDVNLKKTERSRNDDHNLSDSICIARFGFVTEKENG